MDLIWFQSSGGLFAVLNNTLFIVKQFGTPGSTKGIESQTGKALFMIDVALINKKQVCLHKQRIITTKIYTKL